MILLFLIQFTWAFDLKPIHHDISNVFRERLDKLESVEAWTKFISDHPELFPKITGESAPSTVVTEEEIKVKDDTFSIGTGHRQSFVKTKFESYKEFLNSPQLFQFAYGLDGPTKVNDPDGGRFLARLQKKMPGIEDQDFTLSYTSKQMGNFYFMRAPLAEDKRNFALRDNLKVLEKVADGVIAREISIVYPLRWYVRMMAGTMRNLMKDEMNKVARSEKCILEQENGLTPEAAKSCWQKAQ